MASWEFSSIQTVQSLLGELRVHRIRMVLDHRLVRAAREIRLFQPFVAQSQLVIRGRHAVALRVVADHLLKRGDRLAEVPERVVRVPDIQLRIVGSMRGGERLQIELESLDRQVVLAARVVVECRVVGLLRRHVLRRGGCHGRLAAARPWGRRGAGPAAAARRGRHRRDRLAQRLELLRHRRQADVGVVRLLAQHRARLRRSPSTSSFWSAKPFRVAPVCSSIFVPSSSSACRRARRASAASCACCSCSIRISAIICWCVLSAAAAGPNSQHADDHEAVSPFITLLNMTSSQLQMPTPKELMIADRLPLEFEVWSSSRLKSTCS